MSRDAIISECGKYRYALSRNWGSGQEFVCFIMLNPSTADAEKDDPTIRRCISFARTWGYSNLEVVNLFAWRTPYPGDFRNVADPVGPDNGGYVLEALTGATVVIAAWGGLEMARPRAREVVKMTEQIRKPLNCLGVTKSGGPRHPLYVRGDVVLRAYGIGGDSERSIYDALGVEWQEPWQR